MQLGAAPIGSGDELSVCAPAETPHRVLLDGDRALRLPAGGRERPRFVGARALIGDDREGLGIGRKSERRAAREPACGVRDAGEPLARVEIGERTLRHDEAMLFRLEDILDPRTE